MGGTTGQRQQHLQPLAVPNTSSQTDGLPASDTRRRSIDPELLRYPAGLSRRVIRDPIKVVSAVTGKSCGSLMPTPYAAMRALGCLAIGSATGQANGVFPSGVHREQPYPNALQYLPR